MAGVMAGITSIHRRCLRHAGWFVRAQVIRNVERIRHTINMHSTRNEPGREKTRELWEKWTNQPTMGKYHPVRRGNPRAIALNEHSTWHTK